MRTKITPSCIIAMALMVCTASVQARNAQGFEPGDPAVSMIGDAGTLGSLEGQAAPQGSTQFLLTTIGSMSNEDTLTAQSGVFAVGNMSLQNFVGFSLTGTEGSAVLIPFTVLAGDTQLTLQYDFLTNEFLQSLPRDDFAFAAILNSGNSVVASQNPFAHESNPPAPFSLFNGQSPFQFHTGLQSLSFSIDSLAPGHYMLAVGIEDKTTADHASGLLIDNVQVVPEPSVIALAVAGAGLMVAVRRRIKGA